MLGRGAAPLHTTAPPCKHLQPSHQHQQPLHKPDPLLVAAPGFKKESLPAMRHWISMAGSKPPPWSLKGTQSCSEKRDTTLAEAFKLNPLFSRLHFLFVPLTHAFFTGSRDTFPWLFFSPIRPLGTRLLI